MNFLQSKKDKRGKSSYDPSDVVGTLSEEGYIGGPRKSYMLGKHSSGSVGSDGGRKWSSLQDASHVTGSSVNFKSDDIQEILHQDILVTDLNPDISFSNYKNLKCGSDMLNDNKGTWAIDNCATAEITSTLCLDINGHGGSDHPPNSAHLGFDSVPLSESTVDHHLKLPALNQNSAIEQGPSIPQILYLICDVNDESLTANKRGALLQLVEGSTSNGHTIWSKYFNQILMVILELLDDSDPSIREMVLSLIVVMLKNQKNSMEDSVEILIEKLLHVTKDNAPKVSSESEHCLTIVLSQYDPFRCLSVIVPLLVTEDERTLITCINCLTKLVCKLSQEELMGQLPSFLPALFDAFGNQSADIRKTVVFCLVDVYIMLGKAFLPYLEGLNSTQLRLVTIYASQDIPGEDWYADLMLHNDELLVIWMIA